MDTIKILLGMTVALLLGALAMSWKGFQQEQQSAPKDELAQLQREIEQIRKEREMLSLERERLLLGDLAGRAAAVPDPLPAPVPDVADAPMVADVPAIPEVVPLLSAPPEANPPPAIAAAPGGDERAKKIAAAAVVAKITEWVEDPQLGAFATIEVKDPALKAGSVICVRRNSGILGRLKVAEVTPEGGIANAMSQFAGVKPQAGDELIVEP